MSYGLLLSRFSPNTRPRPQTAKALKSSGTFPKMPLSSVKIPSRSFLRRILALPSAAAAAAYAGAARPLSSVAAESRTQKLERIADELLSLTKAEREDYAALFRLKLGLNLPSGALASSGSAAAAADAPAAAEEKEKEKTAFDIKLDKFDAAAKIKVIKEVRAFTDLGLKEAKELVEKAPVVVKKGVAKEEAEAIAAKLKGVGATVVLE